MARAGMADLITRVRALIGDMGTLESEEYTGRHFTDDQIQDALDARGTQHVELPLLGILTRTSLGVEQYLKWTAGRGAWETGATVLDDQSVPVTSGVTALPLHGIWTFTESQDAVYVTGSTFDLYGTAADLLDEWGVSASAGSISAGGTITEWETDGQRVKRVAATSEERRALAASYRAMSLPTHVGLQRSDMSPEPMGPFGWR